MTYQLKRITDTPNSPMRVMISDPNRGDLLNSGGTYFFAPAGQDGDRHDVSDYVAREVMGDKSMAPHFTCEPPLDAVQDQPAASNETTDAVDSGAGDPTKPRRRRAAAAPSDVAE